MRAKVLPSPAPGVVAPGELAQPCPGVRAVSPQACAAAEGVFGCPGVRAGSPQVSAAAEGLLGCAGVRDGSPQVSAAANGVLGCAEGVAAPGVRIRARFSRLAPSEPLGVAGRMGALRAGVRTMLSVGMIEWRCCWTGEGVEVERSGEGAASDRRNREDGDPGDARTLVSPQVCGAGEGVLGCAEAASEGVLRLNAAAATLLLGDAHDAASLDLLGAKAVCSDWGAGEGVHVGTAKVGTGGVSG